MAPWMTAPTYKEMDQGSMWGKGKPNEQVRSKILCQRARPESYEPKITSTIGILFFLLLLKNAYFNKLV